MTDKPGFVPPKWGIESMLSLVRPTRPMAWTTRDVDWSRRRHHTTVNHTRRYLFARHLFGIAWNALTHFGWRHKFLTEYDSDEYGTPTVGIDESSDYGITVYDETEAEYEERSKGFPKTIAIPRSSNGSTSTKK